MKYLIAFGAGAALTLLAAFAKSTAAPPKPHGLEAYYAELGLTADQRAKIDPRLRTLEERVGPLCREIADHRRALYAELAKDAPDPARVDAEIDAMTSRRRDLQRAVADHLNEVRPILTPDQRARLFAWLQDSEIKK